MSEGERSRKTSIVGVTASGAPTDTPSESLKEPLLDLGGGDSAHMSVNVVDGMLHTDGLEDTAAIKIVETEDEHSPSSDVEAKRLLQDSKGAEEVEAAVASCGSSHQAESSAPGEGTTARRTRSRLSQISTRLSFMGHHRPTTCAIDVPNADSPHYSVALAFDNLISSVKTGIEEKKNLPELVVAGSSGSYWVYDANGEKVGIFKPKSEEPYGPANPKWGKWFHRVMCPCCFGRSCLLPNTGYLSEAAAFAMDVLMDLRVVPPTAIVSLAAKTFNYNAIERRLPHLPKKIGSFQVLVQCNGDGKSLTTDSLKKPAMTSLMSDFQRLVCLDYMTRNTDRGLDNWLTNVSGDKVKVHAIDNGLAFPYKVRMPIHTPDSLLHRLNNHHSTLTTGERTPRAGRRTLWVKSLSRLTSGSIFSRFSTRRRGWRTQRSGCARLCSWMRYASFVTVPAPPGSLGHPLSHPRS